MVKVAACLPRKGSTPELCGMCVNLMRHLMRSHLMKMRISIRSNPCPCEERVMVTLRAIMHLTYQGRPAGKLPAHLSRRCVSRLVGEGMTAPLTWARKRSVLGAAAGLIFFRFLTYPQESKGEKVPLRPVLRVLVRFRAISRDFENLLALAT